MNEMRTECSDSAGVSRGNRDDRKKGWQGQECAWTEGGTRLIHTLLFAGAVDYCHCAATAMPMARIRLSVVGERETLGRRLTRDECAVSRVCSLIEIDEIRRGACRNCSDARRLCRACASGSFLASADFIFRMATRATVLCTAPDYETRRPRPPSRAAWQKYTLHGC